MRRARRLALIVAGALALGGLGVSSMVFKTDASRRELIDDDGAPSTVPRLSPGSRHLLLVMVDGLPVAPFERAYAAGELPRLQRLLERRPTKRMHALSTFPSATAPSLPELLAGRYVELDDLPAPGAVHAFDRAQRRVVRYVTEPDAWDWPIPNLFDAVGKNGMSAVTVFEGRWEGPEPILTTAAVARAAALEVIGAGEIANGDRGPVRAFIERIEQRGAPDVALLVLNEVDLKGHFHGPDSPEVRKALTETDALLGETFDALDKAGVLDDTSVILFGDHGMSTSGRHLDLAAHFRDRGVSAYDASTLTHVVLRERLGETWTRWPDVILVSGGSNITQVYLRRNSLDWRRDAEVDGGEARPHLDEETVARELVDLEGVGQVFRLLDENTVEVRASGGRRALIVERGEGDARRWAYVVDTAEVGDPFGYLDDEKSRHLCCVAQSPVNACFHSAKEWSDATWHQRYPAVVPLVPKAFHPGRFTGDIMVTALPGWSFIKGQRGDHGNLEREAMFTMLVLNGPGIVDDDPPEHVRLVDIYPTAAVLLGAAGDDPALLGLTGRPLPFARGPKGAD